MSSVSIKSFLIFIAILSLIIGAIGGLYQIKIKRLLAFSAINHIGFLIIALCINNKVSLESFIFYLTQYSLTTLNIFLILIAFGYLTYIYPAYGKANTNNSSITNSKAYSTEILGLQNQNLDLNYIGQLTNLFNNNPMLTLSFVICLFSIAGTPPLLGFFAKQQILLSALSVGFVFVSIIAINMSVVSAVYYLKLIQVSSFINSNIPSTLKNMLIIANKKQELQLNNEIQKTNNSNIINSFASTPVGAYTNLNLTFNFSNFHTYLISILTLIILLYTLKPTLLLNLTYILSSYSYIL
jgi:NADH-ubiquinone oxidoreductase chain 2